MKKLIIIIATVGFFTPQLKAQQDPMLSQYMFNGLYINPAYAGSHKYWSSTLSYRNQWVGLEGAPSTAIAAVADEAVFPRPYLVLVAFAKS